MTKRGFTLIEILVAVAIFGMLSSIVLVSLNAARDRGRIASGLAFENNVYHTNGDRALFSWDFDGISGNNVPDTTINNLDGTLINSPVISGDVPYGDGNSILLNGSLHQHIDLGTTPNAVFNSQTRITIVAWIKTDGSANPNDHDQAIVGFWNNFWLHISEQDSVYCPPGIYFGSGDSGNCAVGAPVDVQDGKWHQIAVTATAGVVGGAQMYVDGRLAGPPGTISFGPPSGDTGSNLQIGYIWNCSTGPHPFNGYITKVSIYASSVKE